ncbi:MAG TPA: cell division protein ZapA [Pyrinomonadaceae bacterium]|nr:cell division protein ZapA [Pyrinomonadaceae bacterium]
MSSDAPKPPFKSVEVNIFNQVYNLRTNREVEHIKRIAGLVDERMRLISGHTTAHDLAKIAIFAALNIADELSDTREYYESEFRKLLTRQSVDPGDVQPAGEPEDATVQTTGQTTGQVNGQVKGQATGQATEDAPKSGGAQSWFEDIFDSPESEAARGRSERLSSKVSAKLQSLRQPPKETSFSIEEDN